MRRRRRDDEIQGLSRRWWRDKLETEGPSLSEIAGAGTFAGLIRKGKPAWWIWMVCLHEMGDTVTACDTLRGGPKTLTANPLYHYNLGCYHAVLGDLGEATPALRQAFKLDSKLAEMAKTDPDLDAVRELLDSLG